MASRFTRAIGQLGRLRPGRAVGELFRREPEQREPPREPPGQPPQPPIPTGPPEEPGEFGLGPPGTPEEPPGIGRGGPPSFPVGEATFIAEGYGPVRMSFTTRRSFGNAATWFSNTNYYVRGGSYNRSGHVVTPASHFASRIESMEGMEVRGFVLDGPPEIINTTQTLTLETSIDMIDDWYNSEPGFASYVNIPRSDLRCTNTTTIQPTRSNFGHSQM